MKKRQTMDDSSKLLLAHTGLLCYTVHTSKSRTAFFKIFLSVRRILFSTQICFFHGISAGKYKFDELADHTDGMYTYTNAGLAVTPQIAAFADLKQILDKIRILPVRKGGNGCQIKKEEQPLKIPGKPGAVRLPALPEENRR